MSNFGDLLKQAKANARQVAEHRAHPATLLRQVIADVEQEAKAGGGQLVNAMESGAIPSEEIPGARYILKFPQDAGVADLPFEISALPYVGGGYQLLFGDGKDALVQDVPDGTKAVFTYLAELDKKRTQEAQQ